MNNLIEDYLAGPQKLRDAVAGMSEVQRDGKPVPGKWSTRQVVCHITDCEVVYADRMKRVIVEDGPTMLSLDPSTFAAGLWKDGAGVVLAAGKEDLLRTVATPVVHGSGAGFRPLRIAEKGNRW